MGWGTEPCRGNEVQGVIRHHHCDVVVAFAQSSQVHELPAVLVWTAPYRKRVRDFILTDAIGQPVRAQGETIAMHQLDLFDVHLGIAGAAADGLCHDVSEIPLSVAFDTLSS